jgi:hypothetical protein
VSAYLAPTQHPRRAAILAVLDRTPVWMADLALAEMEGASLALVYAAKCLADEHVWGAALRVCAAAAWFAQAGPDDVRWGHIALTAGEVAWQQGRWSLAREQFELAAALLADAPSWQSRAEVGLAMTLLVMGELAEADSMAFSALSRARLAGRTTAWAERVLLWILIWQAAMATSSAAATFHREAALDRLATMGSTDLPGRPAALVELGLAFLSQRARGGLAGDEEGRRLAGEGLRWSHDERGARWCLGEGPPELPSWWGELGLDGLPLAVCDAWMATPFVTDEAARFVEADRLWAAGDPGWMGLFF